MCIRDRLKGFRKGKKGGKGKNAAIIGNSGALKRLGQRIEEKKAPTPEEVKKANMKNVDVFLQKANQKAPGTEQNREITKRTLTMCSKAKEQKNRALVADRMVRNANTAQCNADKRHVARAAAKLPAMAELSEGSEEQSESMRGSERL